MKLKSDFSDYYDHHFDLDGPVFERMGTGGPTKREQFKLLEGLGLDVPMHGMVYDLAYHLNISKWLVVYTDETRHAGEGKQLLSLDWIRPEHWKLYCSLFLPPGKSSIRELHVGRRSFRLLYTTYNDWWRSNCGDGSCVVLGEMIPPFYRERVRRALFAVDFVPHDNKLYAIDFNIAPGIRGSGLERVLPPKTAFEEIAAYGAM